MDRWVRFAQILPVIFVLTTVSPAQFEQPQAVPLQPSPSGFLFRNGESEAARNSLAEKEKEARERRRSAFALLDLVLTGAKNLSLPQNRIAIATEAFPMLWTHNEAQARSLVTEIIGDFAEAATRQADNSEPNQRPLLRQQWQVALRSISQDDPELALSFLNATRAFVQTGSPEQEEAEERGLRLEVGAQEAARNLRNALGAAEKELRNPGDLRPELINLLSQVSAKDPEAGTQLLRDIASRLRGAHLEAGEGNFNFALNLLNVQLGTLAGGAAPDQSLKMLADAVASAALNPEFPATTLPGLQGWMTTFEQLAPARVRDLRQRVEEYTRRLTPEQESWGKFSDAQARGDPNQLLAVAEQAPADIRSNMYQQVAWQLANTGNLQRARQVADKLEDPFQREQVLQQAVRQSAWNASNNGEFAAARQLAQEVTPEEDRAILLAQLASNAASAKQERLAQEMLEEASGLLSNRPAGASSFAAQLQVAQALARVKPSGALALLERSASQLEQVLGAAVEVDAFLPYPRSFESGELILNNSFLCNSLIRPYAEATAELANYDLASARILADRLPLPEARLLAELLVARTVLEQSGHPIVSAVVPGRGSLTFVQVVE